ncbi:cilia- and flagella-associated protein 77-like [Physella acuta]|uniref:cilia- and flagella-associated protein 77-like n=1 Tax=Physella acuta TaxID=109671 RepID=UPI0027DC7121|nr:cilia- and flagella-associated protein 77-like [Physella acuta]
MPHPWELECDPFNLTTTGFLGRKRVEMLTNELLLKDKIGKPKLRGRRVPKNITHGVTMTSPWTAAHAMTGWSGCLPTKAEVTGVKDEPKVNDYLQMNRGAITSGVVTSQEFRDFKKKHFRMLAPAILDGVRLAKKMERPPPKKFPPDTVFGRPNVKDPPFSDVLIHKFQSDWLLSSKKAMKMAKSKKSFDEKWSRWMETRASQLRVKMAPVEVEEVPWRLPKFIDAKPHLSTFRSEKEREDAWNAHGYNRVGCLGQSGQGVTQSTIHDHAPEPYTQTNFGPVKRIVPLDSFK